jgi:hypothetical protein
MKFPDISKMVIVNKRNKCSAVVIVTITFVILSVNEFRATGEHFSSLMECTWYLGSVRTFPVFSALMPIHGALSSLPLQMRQLRHRKRKTLFELHS